VHDVSPIMGYYSDDIINQPVQLSIKFFGGDFENYTD
jgi:hypothetical protein